MNDKLQQIYDLYKSKGIISTTDFNTFATADESQRKQLYDLGVSKGLFKSTDYGTFNTAWGGSQPVKKKASSELASKSGEPTLVSSAKEVNNAVEARDYSGKKYVAPKQDAPVSSKVGESKLPGEYLDSKNARYRYYNGKWYGYSNNEIDQKTGVDRSVYDTMITDTNRVKTLEKMFNKAEYVKGYPGKEEKEYRFKYNQWYEDSKDGKGFTPIQDPVRVGALNKQFKKEGSTVLGEKTFVGYPGKESNEYKVSDDGAWMYRPKGSNNWSVITNEGSILSLNKQFGQKVDPKKQDLQNLAVKNAELNDINHKIDAYVTSNLIDDREGVVTDVLSKKFPQFNFEQSTTGVDRMTVSLKGSQDPKDRIEIVLDNWEDSDDKLNANLLKSFMKERVNMADSRTNLQEKESPFLTRDIESKQRALEAGSGQKEFEQPELVINKDGSVSYAEKPKTTATEKAVIGIEEKQQLKEARQEYFSDKSNYLKTLKNSYSKGEIDNKEFQTAVAAIKVDDKEIKRSNEFVNDVNYSRKKLTESQDFQEKYINDVTEKLKSGEITQEQYDAEYQPKIAEMNDSIEKQKEQLKIDNKSMDGSLRAMERAVAENRLVQEQIGSTGGAIAYNAIKMATDLGRLAGLTPEDQEAFIRDNFGIVTTQEFIGSKDRTFLQKAAMSSASTGVAIAAGILGGAPLSLATLWAAGTFEMFDDEEMKDVPKRDKFLMSAAYGVVSSYLEKIGLDELVGGEIGKKLAMNVVKDAATKLTKDAPKEYIENLLISETKSRLQQAGVKVGVGMLAEGTTEALQSLASVSTKEVYDQLKGTEYFNNKSGWEIASDVLYDGALGAVGGGMISSVVTGSQQVVQGRRASNMDAEIKALIAAAETEGMSEAVKTTLKAKIIRGEITKADAINILGDFDIIKSKVDQMPNTLTEEGKAASLDLMLEKDKLEKQIEGKDPNLVEPQKKRVNEINDRLKQIGEDAVQKQTTSEVPVQSETGVSKEVEGRVSQPTTEQATEEVIGEEVVGEEVKGEQAQAEITQQEEVAVESIAKKLENSDNTELKKQLGIESNWDMLGESDLLSGNDPVLAYTQRKLPEWNRESQLGNINPESELTYSIVKGRFGAEDNKNVVTAKDENGVTVGIVELSSNGGIENIAVAPEFRKKEVSNKLIEVLKENNPKLDLSKTKLRSKGFEKAFSNKIIADAYQKAKKDGSNPSLVKAVDDLLAKKSVAETAPSTESELDFEVTPEVTQEADALEKLLANEGITVEAPVVEEVVAEEPIKTKKDLDKEFNSLNKEYVSDSKLLDEATKNNEDTTEIENRMNETQSKMGEISSQLESLSESIQETPSQPVSEMPLTNVDLKSLNQEKINSIYEAFPKETKEKYFPAGVDGIKSSRFVSNLKSALGEVKAIKAIRQEAAPVSEIVTEVTPVAEAKPTAKPKAAKKLTVKEIVQKYNDHIDSLIKAEKEKSDRKIVQLDNQKNSAREERRKELNQEIENLKIDFIAKKISLEKKKNDKQAAKDFNDQGNIKPTDILFQLDSDQETTDRKKELLDIATAMMEDAEKEGFSEEAFTAEQPEPQVELITIDIKENTELANKVKRMGLSELIGKRINLVMADQLKVGKGLMGGPFFPLINKLFGKVAWASINDTAAIKIINGAIKSDYTVVYNMNPEAIDSNVAVLDSFERKIQDLPKKMQQQVFTELTEYLNEKKFGEKTDAVRKIASESKNLNDFLTKLNELDVDTIASVVKSVLPSKTVNAGTKIGATLQSQNISIEDIRAENIEQFVADLPAGALTMVLQVTDKNGNKVTKKTAREALISREQQKAEGLPIHKNYPVYIRGKAVGILKETTPFWNVFKDSLNEINVKVAGIVKHSTGRGITSKEAVSNEMRSASMTASQARKVMEPTVDMYKKFVSVLSRSIPGVNVVTSQKEFNDLLENLNTQKLSTKNQKVYGAVYKGKIYLNPSLQNYNTPIHEFGHIWLNVTKTANQELYNKGIDLIKDSDYVDQIKNNKDYQRVINEMVKNGATQEEVDSYIYEEALATAIGDKGESFVKASQALKDFKSWLDKLYSFVRKLMGISKYTAEQLQDISLDEFLQAVSVDLLSGEKLFDVTEANMSDALQLMSKTNNISKIIDIAAKNGVSNEAVKLLLARQGFSISDINAAFVKKAAPIQKGKVSKVTVNEKTALKDQIRLEARAAKEGAKSVSDAVKAITAFFKEKKNQGNLTRANLTSIINIISSVKDQKTLDAAADKIYKMVSSADSDIIEVSEYKMLKNQLRLEARVARDAKKDLNEKRKSLGKVISDMETTGKITTKQSQVLMDRINKVNLDNPAKVDAFIEYAGRIFENAEFAQNVSRARSLQSKVKNNAKTKLGIANDLISEIIKMASINPSLIPSKVFNTYMETMEMLGQRTAVLKLEDRGELTQKVADILDAVNEELSVASEMAERFEAYDKKEVDIEGKIDFAKTLSKMVADGTITEEDADIMRKYKSDIVDKESTKMTEEELEEERKSLVNILQNETISNEALDNLPSRLERDLAKSIKALIKTDAVKSLNNATLKNMLKLVDNINNGFVPHYAQSMKERLTSINNAPSMDNSVRKGKPLKVSSLTSRVKSLFTKKNYVTEMIRSVALGNIDQVFGDFKSNAIFKAMFEGSAKGIAAFNSELAKINDKLEKAKLDVAESLGQDPNGVTMSAFKTMTYLLQLEKDSNPDSKQVNNAVDFINETLSQIDKGSSTYTEMDAELLQEILDKYVNKETGQIDNKKLYSSFNATEKAAIKTIQEVNDSMTEKAVYTAGIIRGDKINPIANYVPHVVLEEAVPGKEITGANDVANFSNSRKPSTKANNLVERTGAVTAISFNPYKSTQNAAKNVLLDFHMTEPIRIARMTINETRKRMEEEGINAQERMFLNAISNAYEEATQNVLASSFHNDELINKVVDYIARAGYQAVLGTSITRTASELLSNMSAVAFMNPAAFTTGVKEFSNYSNPEEGLDIMLNVGSSQTERVMGGNTQGGMLIDPAIRKSSVGMKDTKAKNKLMNTMQMIYNTSDIKEGVNITKTLSDTLMSSPDTIVTRPTWFGAFANEFEKVSGKKVDFDKIKANDEAYMNDNAEAIKSAKENADKAVFNLSATNNAYMGLLKNNISPDSKGIAKAIKVFDNYLTRFTTYEYLNARTAVYALAGQGMISKKQAIGLLAGVTVRMVTYSLLTKALSSALLGLMGGDDDEDDDKTKMQKLGQAAASAGTTLMLGRNFGNIARNIMGYGVEKMNEKYLTLLREGDYDAYQDAIQYTVVPQEKKQDMGKGVDTEQLLYNMLGPTAPFTKSLVYGIKKLTEKDRVAPKESDSDAVKNKREEAVTRQQRERTERVPLEILGTAGFIPLYKDIRKAVNESIYADLKKSLKEQEANKAKKEEMLMGYESKSDMEENNPKLYKRLYEKGGKYYAEEEVRLANENLKNSLRKIEKELRSGEINYSKARILKRKAVRTSEKRIRKAR